MRVGKAWIRVAHCCDIPLREGRAVRIGRREIAIFNLGDRFLAIENRCPHKAGPLADGIVTGAAVVCPLHAWKLSLETGKGLTSASAGSCVKTFPTRTEHGIIFLEIASDAAQDEQAGREDQPVICVENSILGAASESSPAT